MPLKAITILAMALVLAWGCGGGSPTGEQSADQWADGIGPDGLRLDGNPQDSDGGPDLSPKDLPDLPEVGGDLEDAAGDLGDLNHDLDTVPPDGSGDLGPDATSQAPMPPRFLMLGNQAGAGFMRTGSLQLTFQIGPAQAVSMRSPNARLRGSTVLRLSNSKE
jgi:hypothetical protein